MTENPRTVCYACMKPEATCVCGGLRRVSNRTPVIVFQHPRERLHPVGTARFLRLGLEQVEVRVAWNAGAKEELAPSWLPPGTALLYPSLGASELGPTECASPPSALVVLDGTWHTARTLYRDKAWLAKLPQYRLSPDSPSRYRIRREPSKSHVSTLEATVLALRALEPDTAGLDLLLDAFDRMIDEQIAYARRGAAVPRHARARRAGNVLGIPRALAEDFDRLVVLYAESARADPHAPRELVQCVAVELSTGRRFHCLLRGSFGMPTPTHLAHLELSPEDFALAVDEETFRRQWVEFLGGCSPRPVFAAWNQSTLDLVARATGGSASRNALKNAHRSAGDASPGSLDDVVAALGLPITKEPFLGRAGVRVARAMAVARHLQAAGTARGNLGP